MLQLWPQISLTEQHEDNMTGIFAGDTKCLVFPVMCDGYLQLNYSDTNAAGVDIGLRGGFWGIQGNYSIEAIITPYDVNGYGTQSGGGVGFVDSEKTPPSLDQSITTSTTRDDYQSEVYFSHTARKTHKMMLFYNPNVQFYLENTTATNINQPAEYKIVAKIGNTIVESDTLIKADNTLHGYYDSDGYYEGLNTSLKLLDIYTLVSGETTVIELGTANNANNIVKGTELYNSSGTSLGIVTAIDGGELTMSQTQTSGTAYYSQPKEALYLEGLYKIGMSYHNTGKCTLYLNGKKVKAGNVTATNFDPTDSFIGQKPGDKTTQFMGELYEIAMSQKVEPSMWNSSLSLGEYDTLFYYRFGDE